jgi:ATP-dependent Clp protease ATP-binding subunit ClpC
MLEKFTDRSRRVLALANQKAQRLNHEYIDTGHVLLGLIEEGLGVGASVLKIFDVDLGKVQAEAETLLEPGPATVALGKLPQTPGTKKVIQDAIQEARGLKQRYVGTEHLLLGLLAEEEGAASVVFRKIGLSPEAIREQILDLLGAGGDAREIPSDVAERFKDHPLVRQYSVLIDLLDEQQADYTKAGDHRRGVAVRDQKYLLRQQLDGLYRLLM